MKKRIEIYNKIKDCSGVGFHSWCNSNVGLIRKPNNKIDIWKEEKVDKVFVEEIEKRVVLKWYQRFYQFIKKYVRKYFQKSER